MNLIDEWLDKYGDTEINKIVDNKIKLIQMRKEALKEAMKKELVEEILEDSKEIQEEVMEGKLMEETVEELTMDANEMAEQLEKKDAAIKQLSAGSALLSAQLQLLEGALNKVNDYVGMTMNDLNAKLQGVAKAAQENQEN